MEKFYRLLFMGILICLVPLPPAAANQVSVEVSHVYFAGTPEDFVEASATAYWDDTWLFNIMNDPDGGGDLAGPVITADLNTYSAAVAPADIWPDDTRILSIDNNTIFTWDFSKTGLLVKEPAHLGTGFSVGQIPASPLFDAKRSVTNTLLGQDAVTQEITVDFTLRQQLPAGVNFRIALGAHDDAFGWDGLLIRSVISQNDVAGWTIYTDGVSAHWVPGFTDADGNTTIPLDTTYTFKAEIQVEKSTGLKADVTYTPIVMMGFGKSVDETTTGSGTQLNFQEGGITKSWIEITHPQGPVGTFTVADTAVDWVPFISFERYEFSLDPLYETAGPMIFGQVLSASGDPMPNVAIEGLPQDVSTDDNGLFGVEVSQGWTGSITPKLSGYAFTPASAGFSNVTDEQYAIFNIQSAPVFTGVLKAVPGTGTAPLDVTFHTLVSQGTPPYTFAYTFGDGNTNSAGSQQQSHTYTQKGTYTAVVLVTDATGTSQEFQTKVTVAAATDIIQYQDNLTQNADDMSQVTAISGMDAILTDAAANIHDSLNAIENADAAVKQTTRAAIQVLADQVVENTIDKYKAFIAAGQADATDAQTILADVRDMVAAMVVKGVPVLEKTLTNLIDISGSSYGLLIEKILAKENLTPGEIADLKTDKAKAKDFFQSNPHLLADAVTVSGIEINDPTDISVDDIDTVAVKHGLTSQQAALLYDTVDPTLDAGNAVVKSVGTAKDTSIAQIAHTIFDTYYTGKSLVSSDMDPATRNILFQFQDGSSVSASVKSLSIVDAFFPPGLHGLPDGSRLGVMDNFALKFSPYPAFPLDLNADLIQFNSTPGLDTDGILAVSFSGLKLAASSGWDYQPANAFSSVTTSYSVTGGTDPSAEAYAYLVTYDTGSAQLMPPTVLAREDLTGMLDDFFGGTYTIDADTGVIDIQSFQFKPDYLFTDLSAIDYTGISAGGGLVYGLLAFESLDYNGDGTYDIKFYSMNPMGWQILYTLSN